MERNGKEQRRNGKKWKILGRNRINFGTWEETGRNGKKQK